MSSYTATHGDTLTATYEGTTGTITTTGATATAIGSHTHLRHSCPAPLPLTTVSSAKIRRGKHIDFDYLLPAVDDIVPVQAAQPQVAKLQSPKESPSQESHRLPNLDGGMEQLP